MPLFSFDSHQRLMLLPVRNDFHSNHSSSFHVPCRSGRLLPRNFLTVFNLEEIAAQSPTVGPSSGQPWVKCRINSQPRRRLWQNRSHLSTAANAPRQHKPENSPLIQEPLHKLKPLKPQFPKIPLVEKNPACHRKKFGSKYPCRFLYRLVSTRNHSPFLPAPSHPWLKIRLLSFPNQKSQIKNLGHPPRRSIFAALPQFPILVPSSAWLRVSVLPW